jgi:hypothetical protein
MTYCEIAVNTLSLGLYSFAKTLLDAHEIDKQNNAEMNAYLS